jgi:hypothetical protein
MLVVHWNAATSELLFGSAAIVAIWLYLQISEKELNINDTPNSKSNSSATTTTTNPPTKPHLHQHYHHHHHRHHQHQQDNNTRVILIMLFYLISLRSPVPREATHPYSTPLLKGGKAENTGSLNNVTTPATVNKRRKSMAMVTVNINMCVVYVQAQ